MGSTSHSSGKKQHRSHHESGSSSKHHTSGSSSHRHGGSSVATGVHVVVQPPTQASTGTALYPPLVARGNLGQIDANTYGYTYAVAVLYDTHGNVVADQMTGTTAQTAVSMAEPAASSRRSGGSGSSGSSSSSSSQAQQGLYYAFPDLAVMYPGNYVLQVNMYMVDSSDNSTRLLAQDHGLAFSVCGESVAAQRAAPEERSVLQRLREHGVAVYV